MYGQTRMPDSEAAQRHARNVQAACHQLEMFTKALDDLIAQLESEMHQHSRKVKSSFAVENVKQTP
jgi:NH3-dependent NAD+ synthetase